MSVEAQDIDPAQALDLLPKKIADRAAIITELALELSVANDIDGVPVVELDRLEAQIAMHKKFKAMYIQRLEAIRAAVAGG